MSNSQINTDITITELAALISQYLEDRGITAVLSGGSVVTIYLGENFYESRDLDFISPNDHQKILEAMSEIGFTPITKNNRSLGHAKTDITVEFPTGPLNFGGAPVRYDDIVHQTVGQKKIRMLSPTQSVMDRLLHFLSHGRDIQSLEQAQWICERYPIDYEEIKHWAKSDGMASDEEYEKICNTCETAIKTFNSNLSNKT